MKMISRTFTDTIINASSVTVNEEGEIVVTPLECLTIKYEKLSKEASLKEVQNVFGKSAHYVVRSVDHIDTTYEVSVEDFLKISKEILATQKRNC